MKYKRWFAAMAVALILALGAAQAEGYREDYSYAVIAEANVERARYGLTEFRVDPELMAAARVRCEEITRKFSHTRPDGTSGRSVSSAVWAENIARGHNNPDRVTAAWMSSAGHRRNLLAAGFTSIGACCIQVGNVCYWVQVFGK